MQDVVDAVELEVHRALDHLVALRRRDVHVLGGDEAAGAPDHVELEHLVVGPAHLDAHAQRRHFQNVPRLRHDLPPLSSVAPTSQRGADRITW
jgi:hypothetical protein